MIEPFSWNEEEREGVPATVITDSTAAHVMGQGRIDAVIVGADRDRPEYPGSEQIAGLCARIDPVPPPLKRAMVHS